MKQSRSVFGFRGLIVLPALCLVCILAAAGGMLLSRGTEPATLRDLSGDRSALDGFAFDVVLSPQFYGNESALETISVENGVLTKSSDWPDGCWDAATAAGYREGTAVTLPVVSANGSTKNVTLDHAVLRIRTLDAADEASAAFSPLIITLLNQDPHAVFSDRLSGDNSAMLTYSDEKAVYQTTLQTPALPHWGSLSYDGGIAVTDDGRCFVSPILTTLRVNTNLSPVTGSAPLLRIDSLGVSSEDRAPTGTVTEIASYDTLDGKRRLSDLAAIGNDLLLVTLREEDKCLDLYRFSGDGEARGTLTLPYEGENPPLFSLTQDGDRYILHFSDAYTENDVRLTEVLAPAGGELTAEPALTLDNTLLSYFLLRQDDRLLLFTQELAWYGAADETFGQTSVFGGYQYPRPYLPYTTGLRLTVLDVSGEQPEPIYEGLLDIPAADDAAKAYYAPFPLSGDTTLNNQYAYGGLSISLREKGDAT